MYIRFVLKKSFVNNVIPWLILIFKKPVKPFVFLMFLYKNTKKEILNLLVIWVRNEDFHYYGGLIDRPSLFICGCPLFSACW